MAVGPEVRNTLLAFAKSRRKRVVQFTPRAPSRWQPRQFTDPRTKQAFTDEGAWEYIIEQLEAGAEIEETTLAKPSGAKAYVLFLPGRNETKIYVKLQICGDHVRGRSFHESESVSENEASEFGFIDETRGRQWQK